MMTSVVIGFLKISKVSLLSSFIIARSRKFILVSYSSSKVKFSPGDMLLNKSRISFIFVWISL